MYLEKVPLHGRIPIFRDQVTVESPCPGQKMKESDEILRNIESRVDIYTTDLCEKTEISVQGLFGYVYRIWNCWAFHCEKSPNRSPCNGLKVASSVMTNLEQGKNHSGQCDLDGNPVHDVVLAEAMSQHENKAWLRFIQLFQDDFIRKGKKFGVDEQWWNDFLVYLGFHTASARREREKETREVSQKKIDGYSGHVGLRRWLKVVTSNFLLENIRKEKSYRTRFRLFPNEWLTQYASTEEKDRHDESPGIFMSSAFHSLPSRLRETILYIRVGQLTIYQIAKIYQVTPGTVSKWHKKALKLLKRRLSAEGGRYRRVSEVDEHILKILDEPDEFFSALIAELDALGQAHFSPVAPTEINEQDDQFDENELAP